MRQSVRISVLLMFAVLLGSVPAFAEHTFAATYQAESGTTPADTAVVDDPNAVGGKALKFNADATSTKQITTTEDATKIAVWARGRFQDGSRATLSIKLDGTSKFRGQVASNTYSTYAAVVTVPAGTHTIGVAAKGASSSRPLFVDNIRLPTAHSPDADGDGVPDASDNCPNAANPDQADEDGDSVYGTDASAGFDAGGNTCDELDNRYGLKPANTPDANRAALEALSNKNGMHLILPAADYHFNNTAGSSRITLDNFDNSIITFQQDARMVFDNYAAGWRLENSEDIRIEGLRMTTDLPANATRLDANTCFHTVLTTDLTVDGVTIERYSSDRTASCAGGGFVMSQATRPTVLNADIRYTLADGLHFANSRDVRAEHITTYQTGDDGLAFLSYLDKGHSDWSGGVARDINVQKAEARGITILGQSGIEISDFYVEETQGAGVRVAREVSYNTNIPKNNYVYDEDPDSDILRAGWLEVPGDSTPPPLNNRSSIQYSGTVPDDPDTAVDESTRFEGIKSVCPYRWHISKGGQEGETATFIGINEVDCPSG